MSTDNVAVENGGGDDNDVKDEKKVGSFMKSTTTATAAVATRIGWEGTTSLNNLLCLHLSMTISMLHLYPPPTRNRVVIGMNNEGGVVKMDT